MLKVHNLKKSFGGVKAVDIDKIFFERNQLTSIIGPNGAGKTTLFRLLCGDMDVGEATGYITINGESKKLL